MSVEYREIDAAEVDPAQRRLAALTLAIVARDLGLAGVALRWFRPLDWRDCEERRALGRASWLELPPCDAGDVREGLVWGHTPDTIWIRAGLGADRLREVIAHEARHAWQRRRAGGWSWGDAALEPVAAAAREVDALIYGRTVYGWFD